jgi:predicted metal-dependent peptidase
VEVPENSSPAADQQAQQQSQQALAQAYQEAKQRGELPAGMDKFVGDLLTAKVDWRNVVREFITANAKVDVSWSRPSRKWLAQGHYLPSLSGQSLGVVVILNDTSGSLDSMEWRTLFRSEVEGIMDSAMPRKVVVMHHDSIVQRVETWEPGDCSIPWNPCGGGGTDHRPCFEAISALDEPADLVISMTDLCTVFPASTPPYPVLWATTEDRPIPFGRKVLIDC